MYLFPDLLWTSFEPKISHLDSSVHKTRASDFQPSSCLICIPQPPDFPSLTMANRLPQRQFLIKPKSPKHHTCRVEAKDKVLMGDSRCLHITVDSNIKVSNLKWEEKDLQKIKNRCTPILNLYVCYEKIRLQLNLQENTPFLWLHN